MAGVLLLVLAANAGKLLVIDAPEPADVIMVLAGETDRRPARAVELLSQGYARQMVINVPVEARIYGISQVELAQRYVQSLAQRSKISICPIEGLSTRDESRDAGKCLANVGGSRILIVTSDFHTRRALSVFRHELHQKSFSIAATHDDAQFGELWWTHRQWAKTCFEEWLRTLWWMGVDRWGRADRLPRAESAANAQMSFPLVFGLASTKGIDGQG